MGQEVARRDRDARRVEDARRALEPPPAAGLAGIAFALLYGASLILVRKTIPSDSDSTTQWLIGGAPQVRVALTLLPFAGIAFLWFMGVIRDRFGEMEDRFFSTVFFGSGLLFLGMTFVGGTLTAGVLAGYAAYPEALVGSGVYLLARTASDSLINLYGVRMSAVFMMSAATLWVRTEVMPRWLSLLTYPIALVLLLSGSLSLWATLVFPIWVFIVSVYVLIVNLRRAPATNA
jgi:hypothetical protein